MDQGLRVKVADFGTGRITSKIERYSGDEGEARSSSVSHEARGRTLSRGVGSLLWMSPEILRGDAVKEGQAEALDVYSFAIVLWEIWYVVR